MEMANIALSNTRVQQITVKMANIALSNTKGTADNCEVKELIIAYTLVHTLYLTVKVDT